MKIAIPIKDGLLCSHFGHCEEFSYLNVNTETKEILDENRITPPKHEPGVLPRWISENGANLVIAGGMGGRAQEILIENGVEVILGAGEATPRDIVTAYLNQELTAGKNQCDH